MTDLNFTPDVQLRNKIIPNKTGAGAGSTIKYHSYNADHEDDKDIYNGDGEGEDCEENVYYTAAKEFPKGYLEHDSEIAIKENEACEEDPQKRNVMGSCPCKLSTPHNTKFGSKRFCKHFLDTHNLKGRMNHLKEINACFKCLQLNHKASTCKARLKCPYCHQVAKSNTKHNAALCANLDDQEFAIAIQKINKIHSKQKKSLMWSMPISLIDQSK